MLTLTDQAQTVVRALTQDGQAPENAGLRILPGNDGLELVLVADPVPGDALIEDDGARVFVEPEAARLLDEQTLDAQIEGGEVSFFLSSAETTSSDDDNGETNRQPVTPGAGELPA